MSLNCLSTIRTLAMAMSKEEVDNAIAILVKRRESLVKGDKPESVSTKDLYKEVKTPK